MSIPFVSGMSFGTKIIKIYAIILKDIPKASALAHPIGSTNSETEGVKESETMPTIKAPRPNALASEKMIEVAVARNLVGKVSLDQIPKTP